MTTQLYKKVDYTVSHLLNEIKSGQIGLPDIQRPFVWKAVKVRELFDSMYRGFPVGYLMFWENPRVDNTRGIGLDLKQHIPSMLIVDGQQRLTSLYAVQRGVPVLDQSFQPYHIRIGFNPLLEKFEVTDASIERNPEYIPDISVLWRAGGTSYSQTKNFLKTLSLSRDLTDSDEEQISNAIDRLFDLQNYPFTVLVINPDVNEEQVADIFVRINSLGVALKQADFILTLMSVFWDDGRRQLEEFVRSAKQPSANGAPSAYNHLVKPEPDQLLRTTVAYRFRRGRLEQVYSLLRGKDLETGIVSLSGRAAQFAALQEGQAKTLDLTSWHEFLTCIKRSGYRSPSMITSQLAVYYSYSLYLIGRHEFDISPKYLRSAIARWFFMSSITSRYSGSFESQVTQDLTRVGDSNGPGDFLHRLSETIDAVLTNDFWEITVPNELERSNARSVMWLAYVASTMLLDAPVLFSTEKVISMIDPAITGVRSALERHHIFPKQFLRSIGITDERDYNQAANFSFIEWGENSRISDTPPAEYYPLIKRDFSEAQIQQMHELHALPDRWHEMTYHEFLSKRRPLMARIIRRGFNSIRVNDT